MSTESPPAVPADEVHADDDPVSPTLARSLDAFRRDLPALLKTHYGRWVAYHGDEQLGFGKTQTELARKCLARGLKLDEFLVCSIEPEIADEDITWSFGA